MTLHLVKLCVGIDDVDELADWQKRRAAERKAAGATHACIHRTRMMPKRQQDLLDGGSLYWVIKGQVLVRQAIDEIVTEEGGPQPCRIYLKPDLIETAPQPRRAFQGWRYLEAGDAPPDLATGGDEAVPQDLARQLRELGAW